MGIAGVVIISIVLSFLFYQIIQSINMKRVQRKVASWLNLVILSQDLHTTLLWGLYDRFKRDTVEDEQGNSFIVTKRDEHNNIIEKKENPFDFERFVARVLEAYYGGEAIVTRWSGDYGVDIEHYRPDGLYLIQVKHYRPNRTESYVPIAIIHSQMVKQGAKGGMVITTGRFTDPAKQYDHKKLGIELLEGKDFVELWCRAMDMKKEAFFSEMEPVK